LFLLTNLVRTSHNNSPTAANTTKTHTTSQSASTSSPNDNEAKNPTSDNGTNQGTSTDNNGVAATPVTSSQDQWSVSQSGDITIKEPIANSLVQSGASLEGSAFVDQVQYTLIDNQIGVISEGAISVVNGDFSATMNFQPSASSGRLDVYSTEPNGKEINLVEIPVNF